MENIVPKPGNKSLGELLDDPWFRGLEVKNFKSCTVYFQGMDFLLYLEKDVSYTAHWIKGSNIELLYDNKNEHLIGVKISQFSQMVPPHVLEAFKKQS